MMADAAAKRYQVTIIVRPQKAELLCRHLLEQQLLEQLTVEEILGLSRGGSIPRAELNGLIDDRHVDTLIDLVATLSRSSLAGDGIILLRQIERELSL